jgi:hypothetical protein
MGYQSGEIPMDNVHGISVSGGSFPAEIWRLMMERTIGLRPVREFSEPREYPHFERFQRGPLALSYDPYAQPATTETTTTETPTTPAKPAPATKPKAAAEKPPPVP